MICVTRTRISRLENHAECLVEATFAGEHRGRVFDIQGCLSCVSRVHDTGSMKQSAPYDLGFLDSCKGQLSSHLKLESHIPSPIQNLSAVDIEVRQAFQQCCLSVQRE